MATFTRNTNIAPLPKENLWITTDSFRYYFSDDLTGEYVEVPKGFKFDGVSTPKLFWILFPPVQPRTINAACLHDWLYSTRQYSLWKSDNIFVAALGTCGMRFFRRYLMFMGLKCGSWVVRHFTGKNATFKNKKWSLNFKKK